MPGDSDAGADSVPPDPDIPAGGDFAALAPDLTKRIGTILAAVQREADTMLDEARSETQQQIDRGRRQAADRQRRIAELSDILIAHAELVVAQLEETQLVRDSFGRLLRALSDAADRVTAEVTAPPMAQTAIPSQGLVERAAARAAAAPAIPLSAPAAEQQAAEAAESERAPGDYAWVEARQAAIQMAAAGNTRTQVETHLRGFLRVADPTALLDQVFGPATGGEARVPWAIAPPVRATEPDDRSTRAP